MAWKCYDSPETKKEKKHKIISCFVLYINTHLLINIHRKFASQGNHKYWLKQWLFPQRKFSDYQKLLRSWSTIKSSQTASHINSVSRRMLGMICAKTDDEEWAKVYFKECLDEEGEFSYVKSRAAVRQCSFVLCGSEFYTNEQPWLVK